MADILLLDDDWLVLTGYARQLLARHVVRTAQNIREALSILEDGFCPDVAIVDYRLEQGTGLDVLKEVRARCPHAWCYIMSGYVETIPDNVVPDLADSIVDKTSEALAALLETL